jgi:hypothetical protein
MTALAVCLRADARARRARLLAGLVSACHERVRRFEVDGVRNVPIAELPREQVRVDPVLWLPGLKLYMAFHDGEARA